MTTTTDASQMSETMQIRAFIKQFEKVNDSKVMIVDDEPINIRVTRKYLSDAGYSNFVTCSDAPRALEVMQNEMPDIVLLDIIMPEVDGLSILWKMQGTSQLRNLPVLILTASNESQAKVQALEMGATDFLTKPIDPSELIPRVRNTLVVKAHQDQLERYAERLEEAVRRRTNELAFSRREVIECLAWTAECRDKETGRHIIRVGKYCAALAKQLRLPPEQVDTIELASQLHDVGKISIPDSILRKPGKLTTHEFALMKRHCVLGQRILQRLTVEEFQAALANPGVVPSRSSGIVELATSIALTHHERWDGTGYPNGLKGEQIPLEGRITAVADVYDALSSKRSYKLAFPHHQCLDSICESSGTHFDPRLVDAFMEISEEIHDIAYRLAD